jgi:UDP-glucose 4-epimerase
MNKKILVTGGCGYIGSHTVVELLEHGFEVVIADDLSNSNDLIVDRISKIAGQRPTFEFVDLKDVSKTRDLFKKHSNIDAVIHFAAHKAVGESVKYPLKYYHNNLYALINVIMAMKEYDVTNFIFSSSATVYGNPDSLPITENETTKRPFSSYGNTKKIAEEILEDEISANPDFSAISLRYFNPIGAHRSGLIGEFPSGIPNNLMPYITQTAVGVRDKLMVYGNDYPTRDGTPIRDYIHVSDLAEAHLLAVKRQIENKCDTPFEVFNLGTGTGYTVMEVISTFEKISGQDLKYEVSERRAGDVTALYAANLLAKEKLGWEVKNELNEMINSSWKWEQNLRHNQ